MKSSNLINKFAISSFVTIGVFASAGFASQSRSITIGGVVPVVCKVSFAANNGADQTVLGVASEFCNASNGYRLFAKVEGVAAGSNLIVDGHKFALNSSEIMIADLNIPAIKTRNIGLEAADIGANGAISLRIEAK